MNGAGHLAQLVLRLGHGFDSQAFHDLLRQVAETNPILRAPILRRFAVGLPEYRIDRAAPASTVEIEIHQPTERRENSPPPVFEKRINSRLAARRGRLLTADIVPYTDGRTDLALTWLHMLFDGSGSERFVEHLARCSADSRIATGVEIGNVVFGKPHSIGQRGNMASRWHAALVGDRTLRVSSPGGPIARRQQQLEYDWTRLTPAESKTVLARSAEYSGALTPMLFYLAAAIRAHQAVARHRGRLPGKWLVPLPVNLRKKGPTGEIFRTHVSLLWFHATPDDAKDLSTLVDVLKRQRREAIKGGLIEAGAAAMELARFAPSRLFTALARSDFDGELCSFFFAFTDEFAREARSLCGAPIESGSHVPSVPPSPGSSIVASLRDEQLTLTHIRQNNIMDDYELGLLRDTMLTDLLGR